MLARSQPPVWLEGGAWQQPLGTDTIGRDLLSRCLYEIRTGFGIATLGLVFSAILGVGVQPPNVSLRRLIGDGRDNLNNAWWIVGMPSIVIVTIALLFQLIGDGLRDRVDVLTSG